MSDKTVHLSELEAAALAYRIVALHVSDPDWLEWELYPELDEASFEMVVEQVKEIGRTTLKRSHELDTMTDTDSGELLERAS